MDLGTLHQSGNQTAAKYSRSIQKIASAYKITGKSVYKTAAELKTIGLTKH